MKATLKIIVVCIIAVFVLLCASAFIQDNILYPDDLYKKMNEINENKSLIGLSDTDVIELLGEPKYKSEQRIKSYTYSAGTTVKKSIFVGDYQKRFYDLQINFDENNKVNYTGIKQTP